jgi:hypothetical protein
VRWKWSSLYVSEKMHGVIVRHLGPKRSESLDFGKVYEAAALQYRDHGEPADVLEDLKRRARAAADARRDLLVGPPGVDESLALLASWRKPKAEAL